MHLGSVVEQIVLDLQVLSSSQAASSGLTFSSASINNRASRPDALKKLCLTHDNRGGLPPGSKIARSGVGVLWQ